MCRRDLKNINRIVVKVGTRVLTYPNGKLNLTYMEKLVRQIADLQNQGKEVLLVSSGAVGAGIGRLNLPTRPTALPEKQAVAAVGQGYLMQFYEKFFSEYGYTVAQVLLTREDLRERKRYLNSRNTLLMLLKYNVIPIINENDTVAVEEIEFGDNDTLSALVASFVEADLLVILSTVKGLFTGDPNSQNRKGNDIDFISYIPELTREIMSKASDTSDTLGTGGMVTKLQAANVAVDSGVPVIVANGKVENILSLIIEGKDVGTYIAARKVALPLRKRWLAYGPLSQGSITIDAGASKAIINDGKSLLPAGILYINGSFNKGEMVKIEDAENNLIGRGLTNYNSADLNKIKGLQSGVTTNVLGYCAKAEVVHRDKLVLNRQLSPARQHNRILT